MRQRGNRSIGLKKREGWSKNDGREKEGRTDERRGNGLSFHWLLVRKRRPTKLMSHILTVEKGGRTDGEC